MDENEAFAIRKLKNHLATAKMRGYPREKMIFCDGFLAALCTISGKNYGFSDGEVYFKDENDDLHWV